MDNKFKENNTAIKKKYLLLLLSLVYLTFILFIILRFSPSPKGLFAFRLLEIIAILYTLAIYLAVPLALIGFILVLLNYRDAAQNNSKIIGEIPLTFIVISLMIISFIFGALKTK